MFYKHQEKIARLVRATIPMREFFEESLSLKSPSDDSDDNIDIGSIWYRFEENLPYYDDGENVLDELLEYEEDENELYDIFSDFSRSLQNALYKIRKFVYKLEQDLPIADIKEKIQYKFEQMTL